MAGITMRLKPRLARRRIRINVTESHSDSVGQVKSKDQEVLSHFCCSPAVESVWRAVLVVKDPALTVEAFHRLEVVIGIVGRVPGRAIADLEIDDVAGPAIDQMMAVFSAALEAGAHSGLER